MKQESCKRCGKPVEFKRIGKKYRAVNTEYESTVFRGKIIQFQRLHSETCVVNLEERQRKTLEKIQKIKKIISGINIPEDILK